MMSKSMNRPRLEMTDGSIVPATTVTLTSNTTGKGYNGKTLKILNFMDVTSKGLHIDAKLARDLVLLQIGFPSKDVARARSVLFNLGADDREKRISIVPL